MKNDRNLSQTISFRVTDEVFKAAEQRAALEDKSVNDWCRDAAVQSLRADHGLPPGLQVLLTEFYALRQLLEGVFDLQMRNEFTEREYVDLMLGNYASRRMILEKYFAKQNILKAEAEAGNSNDEVVSNELFFANPNFIDSSENKANV